MKTELVGGVYLTYAGRESDEDRARGAEASAKKPSCSPRPSTRRASPSAGAHLRGHVVLQQQKHPRDAGQHPAISPSSRGPLVTASALTISGSGFANTDYLLCLIGLCPIAATFVSSTSVADY